MDAFTLLAFGGIASGAAIAALVADGFRKPGAALTALAAGVAPWMYFAGADGGLPTKSVFVLIGFVGSVPLFLLAAILYRCGATTPKQNVAIGSCVTGLIAGLCYGLFLANLLARVE